MKYIALFFILSFSMDSLYGQVLAEEIFGEGLAFTEGYDVINTSDQGFLLIGSYTLGLSENFTDPWCIKTDNKGNYVWDARPVFGLNSLYDIGYSGIETEESYIVLGNYSDSETFMNISYLFALDKSDGHELWRKELTTYPNSNYGKIIEVSDGFVMGGSFERSFGDYVYSLIKFDKEGNEVWFQQYDEISSDGFFFNVSLSLDQDDNILLGGSSQSKTTIIKTDSWGEMIWTQNLDAQGSSLAIATTINGDVVSLSSNTYLTNPSTNTVCHLSSNGDVKSILEMDYGFIESPTDLVVSLANEIIIAGSDLFPSEPVVLKLDLNGDTLWRTVLDIPSECLGVSLEEVEITEFNNIAVAGMGLYNSPSGPTSGYVYFAILDGEGVITSQQLIPISAEDFVVYPNPAREEIHINSGLDVFSGEAISIHNMDGKCLKTVKPGQKRQKISLDNMPSGPYVVSLLSADGITMAKEIIIKQ